MELTLADGIRKSVTLDGYDGVSLVIQPLTVRQAAAAAFDTIQVIRHGVLSIHGVNVGGKPVTTGAELADAFSRAQGTTATMRLANKIASAIIELTGGNEETPKNSEPSQQ